MGAEVMSIRGRLPGLRLVALWNVPRIVVVCRGPYICVRIEHLCRDEFAASLRIRFGQRVLLGIR